MTEPLFHISLDIETLGLLPGAAIIAIGAVRFGDEGLADEFYTRVDLLDSLFLGLTVDPETVAWWRTQKMEIQWGVLSEGPCASLRTALVGLTTFIAKHLYVKPYLWAKSPSFDLVLLAHAYRLIELPIPWGFREERDVRTLVAMWPEATAEPNETKLLAHHALHDAKRQAEQVRRAYQHFGLKLDAGIRVPPIS